MLKVLLPLYDFLSVITNFISCRGAIEAFVLFVICSFVSCVPCMVTTGESGHHLFLDCVMDGWMDGMLLTQTCGT